MAQEARNVQGGKSNGDGNEEQQCHEKQETSRVVIAMVMAMRNNRGPGAAARAEPTLSSPIRIDMGVLPKRIC